jgi:hypothetical protein
MVTAKSKHGPGSRLERCLADEEGSEANKCLSGCQREDITTK